DPRTQRRIDCLARRDGIDRVLQQLSDVDLGGRVEVVREELDDPAEVDLELEAHEETGGQDRSLRWSLERASSIRSRESRGGCGPAEVLVGEWQVLVVLVLVVVPVRVRELEPVDTTGLGRTRTCTRTTTRTRTF